MKRLLLLFITFSFIGVNLYSTPVINGANGELTMPIAKTFKQGDIWIGAHYVTGDPTILANIGLGITRDFEFSAAFDKDDSLLSPFLHVGAKYNYYRSRDFLSSIGVVFQNAFGGNGDGKFSIYNVISQGLRGFLYSLGIGYTFDGTSNVNYWMGLSKELFGIKNLWFETDFSNFSYRYWWANFSNIYRGVVNMGIRVYLFDETVRIDFASLDIFDDNRQFTIGCNILLSSIL